MRINYGAVQYEGEYKLYKRDWYGKFYYINGNIYEGEFKNNRFEGIGIHNFTNGDKYEGEFKNNRFEGIGIFNFANGDRYEGEFKNGKFEGYGIFYFSSGFKYGGYFIKGYSTSILFYTYKILSIMKKKLSTVNRYTAILILIFALILGVLINYKFK